MSNVAKVSGFSGLVRDLKTNAILVSDQSDDYSEYRKRISQKDRLKSFEDRILTLEAQNSEIKSLLEVLIHEVRASNVQR